MEKEKEMDYGFHVAKDSNEITTIKKLMAENRKDLTIKRSIVYAGLGCAYLALDFLQFVAPEAAIVRGDAPQGTAELLEMIRSDAITIAILFFIVSLVSFIHLVIMDKIRFTPGSSEIAYVVIAKKERMVQKSKGIATYRTPLYNGIVFHCSSAPEVYVKDGELKVDSDVDITQRIPIMDRITVTGIIRRSIFKAGTYAVLKREQVYGEYNYKLIA